MTTPLKKRTGSNVNNFIQSNESEDAFDALVYRGTPGAPTISTRNVNSNNSNSNSVLAQDKEKDNETYNDGNDGNERTKGKGSYGYSNLVTPIKIMTPTFTSATKLPPKIVIKFFIHEDVSSIQEMKNDVDNISCHVTIDGTVHAQILSSDAKKNPPFALRLSDPDYPQENYQFDTNTSKNFMTFYGSAEFNTLTIPKAMLGQIKVATYQRSVTKKFMPVLVQSK